MKRLFNPIPAAAQRTGAFTMTLSNPTEGAMSGLSRRKSWLWFFFGAAIALLSAGNKCLANPSLNAGNCNIIVQYYMHASSCNPNCPYECEGYDQYVNTITLSNQTVKINVPDGCRGSYDPWKIDGLLIAAIYGPGSR